MMANALMYAIVILHHNNIMCIIPKSYRVAIIIEQHQSIIYNWDVMLLHLYIF